MRWSRHLRATPSLRATTEFSSSFSSLSLPLHSLSLPLSFSTANAARVSFFRFPRWSSSSRYEEAPLLQSSRRLAATQREEEKTKEAWTDDRLMAAGASIDGVSLHPPRASQRTSVGFSPSFRSEFRSSWSGAFACEAAPSSFARHEERRLLKKSAGTVFLAAAGARACRIAAAVQAPCAFVIAVLAPLRRGHVAGDAVDATMIHRCTKAPSNDDAASSEIP